MNCSTLRGRLGTSGLSTQNLCQVVCLPRDANTNTAKQDTTTFQNY